MSKSGANGDFAASAPADKLIDLIFEVKAAYRQRAKFLMARRTVAAIRKLKDGQGNYLVDLRLRDGALVESIFGFPNVDGEDMPAVGANNLGILFGDFGEAYTIVDRLGVSASCATTSPSPASSSTTCASAWAAAR
jgi:HK97 family phage major capsid protein